MNFTREMLLNRLSSSSIRQFYLLICFISLSGLSNQVFSQNHDSEFIRHSNNKYYFKEVTLPENLPIQYTNAIVEDNNGFIWIGTDNELLRYNGHGFKSFYHIMGNPNSITNNCIRSLYVANDTLLMIGTEYAFSILNLRNYQFKNYPEAQNIPVKSALAYYRTHDKVLIGAYNGLFYFDLKTLKLMHLKISLPNTKYSPRPSYYWIKAIEKHPFMKNCILIGTEGGLMVFNLISNKVVQLFPNKVLQKNPNTMPFIYKIYVDGDFAWTTSWVSGLNKVDLRTGRWTNYGFDKKYHIEDFIPINNKEFLIDIAGSIGIRIFDKNTGKVIDKVAEIVSGNMRLDGDNGRFFRQSNGALWIANIQGISRQLTNYKTFLKVNIPSKYLWSWPIIEYPALSKYYFSLTFGKNLMCYDAKQKRWTELTAPIKSKFPLEVRNAAIGPDGNIILVTYRQGVCILNPRNNEISVLTLKNGERFGLDESNPVLTAFFDKKGRLWLGTRSDGIYRINPDRKSSVHYPLNREDVMSIISFVEDRFDRIWIASSKGVVIYDPASDTFSYELNNEIKNAGVVPYRVYSMARDTLGRIWMTIPYTGLIRVEPDGHRNFKVKIFQKQNGLSGLFCVYMTTDKNGCLWIMNNGLLYFNPYNETYHFINEWNGLLNFEGGDARILVDSKGSVFVSDQVMENLVQTVNASKVTLKNLVIDQLYVNGIPYPGSVLSNQSIRLRNSENNLTFFFSDICYDAPEFVLYRYRIEGLEKKWNITTSLSEAHYHHIPPGEYTFIVNAGYRGKWLAEEAKLKFSISQPFWKSIWFIITLIILISGILLIITTIKYRSKLQAERLRTSIASDLHDEINSTLSSISIMSDLIALNDKDDFMKKGIGEISKNAKLLLNKMDDIIWLINPAKDNFEDFELRLKEFMIPLFESKDIQYHFECSPRIAHLQLPVELRKNLFLIIKEAINNLVKYSQCSMAEVILHYDNSVLTATISDNGIGFDPDIETNRNGIRNMKQRASQIKGKFIINSSKEKGTEIILQIIL